MTCACGQPAEWCDKWCQDCWEKETDRQWWEAVEEIQAAEASKK